MLCQFNHVCKNKQINSRYAIKLHILLLTNAKLNLPFLSIYTCHIRKNAYFCAT